jgi:hypothetical protein
MTQQARSDDIFNMAFFPVRRLTLQKECTVMKLPL